MWKCSNCDTPNQDLLTKCEVCGQPRHQESPLPSSPVAAKPLKPVHSAEYRHEHALIDKGLIWRQWLLANTVACSLMAFFKDVTSLFLILVIWGCALGFSQWLVVRKYLHNVGWWGPATAVSFALGFYMILNQGGMPVWFSFGLIGVIVGFVQWIVLRHLGSNSGLWILASAIGWGLSVLALLIYPSIGNTWLQFPSFGIIYGMISGWALLSIFQKEMRLLF